MDEQLQGEVKPLSTLNCSKLPMRSRLKAPTPVSKMSQKRSRSPGENTSEPVVAQAEKKRRVLESTFNSNVITLHSNQTTARGVGKLKRSISTGSLKVSTTYSQPKPSTTTMMRGSSSAKKPSTSVTKPSVTRPVSQRGVSDNRNTVGAKKPPVPSAGSKPPTGATKKRPAWDLKGRLQDMEEILSKQNHASNSLNKQLEDYNDRIASLESMNNHLSGTVKQKEEVASNASKEIQSLQHQLRETEENFDNVKRNMQRELDNITFFKEQLQRQKDALEGEVNAKSVEISGMKSTIAQLTSTQAGLSAELDAVKLQLEQALKAGREKDDAIKQLKSVVCEKEEKIKDFEEKSREHETMRRKLHNTIQELKGNIRVFCRVRPLLGDELLGNPDGSVTHMNFPDTDHKVLELEKIGDALLNESCLNSTKRGGKYEFCFDKVFQPGSSQGVVFEEISQLVQSALDGYNVCIFAYGQTGSGKTYTMEGGEVDVQETKGMIPRAVLQIFESAKELESKGWQYEFESSFLEIYNETIRDLLGNGKDDVKHEIKLTGSDSKDVVVTNLTLVSVKSEEKVHELLKKASHNRAVAETKCNERSSRSHSVFRFKLSGTNKYTEETCTGTLNLVDLAGSERLKDSGSEGQRLKETQAINKSLSCLGNVIMALGNKDSHIPYRNSKLTYLLQNSLGGNSKTLMFVNVSPKEECFQETLNSLRFATKVNQCNIGTAQKKIK